MTGTGTGSGPHLSASTQLLFGSPAYLHTYST